MLPWVRSGREVALLGGQVLVLDQYRLSLFTRQGRFRDILSIAANPVGMQPGVSILAATDTTVLLGVLQSRMTKDTSTEARATIRFYRVGVTGTRLRIDTLGYSLASKERINGGYNRVGVPLYNKFGFQMGETWSIAGGELLALSFRGFGVCRIDPDDGSVLSAIRVSGDPRPTSSAERLQVHKDFPGIDEVMPDGMNWGKELDEHWPATAPWYMHIIAGGRRVATSRSISVAEDQVDLFDDTAYVGSFPVRQGWLRSVVAVAGDSLLRVETDTTTETFELVWYRAARPGELAADQGHRGATH